MHINNIYMAIIQETKLQPHKKIPNFDNYTTIRQDKTTGGGKGLMILLQKNIHFINTSNQTKSLLPANDNTLEIKSIKVFTIKNTHI